MKTKTRLRFADLPKEYASLCALLPPRTIHDAVDYANTAEVTDAMVLWVDDFTPDQRDYFDLLGSLLEAYDAGHVEWPKVTGRDILKPLLAGHGLGGVDLSRILGGSRNLGAMILRGERNLTLAHIRKLAALRRGEQAPARVYRVTVDAQGQPVKRALSPEAFRRAQVAATPPPPPDKTRARSCWRQGR